MCWSSDWEEQELLKDEERREVDERRDAEAAADRSEAEPGRELRHETELVRT
jgi:hypothetical protein